MKIRKAVLLLACAVSWGIAVWFAGRLWAAYPLVSVRSDVPVTGRQLEALRSALRQEDGASALVPAFWSQAEGSAESRWETCGITAILYCGEYDAVYPAVLLEGRFPAAQENGKCAVSTAAAWQLWGSEDVLGQELEIEGDIYRVCGLFRSSASLALCGESLDHGFSNIEFWGRLRCAAGGDGAATFACGGDRTAGDPLFPFPLDGRPDGLCPLPAGVVLLAGIEPARCCHRGILSPLRLPIPPLRHEYGGDTRNRTGDKGFADLCLTAWLCRRNNGAENEIRTRDPLLGKEVLYH